MTHLELSGAADSDPIGRLFESANVKGVVAHLVAVAFGAAATRASLNSLWSPLYSCRDSMRRTGSRTHHVPRRTS
jgi:hypothetical protein